MSTINPTFLRFSALRTHGLLNFPGVTHASKTTVEDLLQKDAERHHCFFSIPVGLHNHLSHHLLAAYDFGATPALLQKIYDDESKIQRLSFPNESDRAIKITEENWTQYVGNFGAYGSFVEFFSERVKTLGVLGTLEKYIFDQQANTNGAQMLARLVSGVLHPLIQIGYGLEFGIDNLVITGIAQAAAHKAFSAQVHQFHGKGGKAGGVSLLELLRQIYGSEKLTPPLPYDPDAFFNKRVGEALAGDRLDEIHRIISQYRFDEYSDEEFDKKVQEIIWTSTLLTFSTGRKGRKPRLDFFLMHLVTSSIFLIPFLKVLKDVGHKADLLRGYIGILVLTTLARGRPRIDPDLLMTYTASPRAPNVPSSTPHVTSKGNYREDGEYNPWPIMVAGVIYSPDAHVIKTMRTLYLAAQRYGDTPPGGAIGAFRDKDLQAETHVGISKLDGTIFARAAGMLLNYMGWVAVGQPPRKDWDRSALGWDAAWEGKDED